MDSEKSFDEKLKKRIKDENVILPSKLNGKINDTLHNLPVKKKSYRVHMMVISAVVLALSIVYMSEFSIQSFAQNGGVFEYVKKKAFSDYENEEEIKLNVNYPDKEKIHIKMLDSIDHFKNISGQFEEYSSSTRMATTYKYAIDTEKQRGIASQEDKRLKKRTIIYNEGRKKEFDDENYTYKESKWSPEERNNELLKLNPTERLLRKSGERKRYDGEYVGLAKHSIQSEFADLLIRYKDWNYKETKYLGLDCYKIEGVINIEMPISASEDVRGKFEMVVEKNTGVMLKFLSFHEGMIQYSVTTEWIQIDKGLKESMFQKDSTKYEKMKNILDE
ncbi:anti-sigma factor [Bacillus toyonensis]|uniref:ECF-type sigma factor negative effector n=1 Tax=Bacillus TaxID=1386 RepID=UPI000330C9AD|nr:MULTISPECIES: ECF-type sigma factor negative effector [Bacillus]EOP24056.1 ECF-type sigma factor negative effector [Bacillus cereus VD131]KAF6559848.1 anti-sigma factor [Bacillus sp. EKM202B]MBJ8040354.1 anti-sigma factor [Bacillus cereus group sp. N17]MCU5301768.1 anti-sigma factor [Bacillus toyonensis]MCU5726733.1 anti-sigma factor [Bacillus toyonensis]